MLLSDWNEEHEAEMDYCDKCGMPGNIGCQCSNDGWCENCERPIALADPGHPYGGHTAQCDFNPNPPSNADDYD